MDRATRWLSLCGVAALCFSACGGVIAPGSGVSSTITTDIESAMSKTGVAREGASAANCTGGYNTKITIPGTSLQLELAAGAGCNQKFILALFGGGWVAGDSTAMDFLISPMLQRGMVYGSLNYTVGAPMGVLVAEVQTALNAARAAAGTLGIDTNKMGVMGVSAGGQLAYQAGFNDGHLSWIGGLYGPSDMNALEAADCDRGSIDGLIDISQNICSDILHVMGGPPEVNPAGYSTYSPINSAANLLNDPLSPHVFVGYSTDDFVVHPEQEVALVNRLNSLGIPVDSDVTTGLHIVNTGALSTDALNNAQNVLDEPTISRDQITAAFHNSYGRDPSADDFNYVLSSEPFISVDQLVTNNRNYLLASGSNAAAHAERQATITRAFEAGYGRAASADDIQYWMTHDSYVTFGELVTMCRNYLLGSSDARMATISQAYQSVLGRAATPEEINAFTSVNLVIYDEVVQELSKVVTAFHNSYGRDPSADDVRFVVSTEPDITVDQLVTNNRNYLLASGSSAAGPR